MRRISAKEAKRISELQSTIGDRRLRTLLTGEDKRLMRPERLEHLSGGSGRLSPWEEERLKQISLNAPAIQALGKKADSHLSDKEKRKAYKTNRAIRDWINSPKQKGVMIPANHGDDIERSAKATKALGYLGYDPGKDAPYTRRRKGK